MDQFRTISQFSYPHTLSLPDHEHVPPQAASQRFFWESEGSVQLQFVGGVLGVGFGVVGLEVVGFGVTA